MALHERQSRILLGVRLESKASDPVAEAMERMLAPLPAEWRRTMTFDNGTEFAKHYRLHELGMETFFCDVRSPVAEGGRVERHRASAADAAAEDGPGDVVG